MGLKAPSKLSTKPSRFPLLPSSVARSSELTQTVPTTSVPRANIKVVIGVTADHSATFTRSANIGVALTVSATGLNTGGVVFGTAVVSVGITSTASANVTRSGVASIDVGITSTCTGALATQTYYGTGVINVGITATATGTSLITHTGTADISASITATATGTLIEPVTHTGTADIQVNIDIVATGLTNNQIPDETATVSSMTLHGDALLTGDAAIGTKAIAFDGSSGYGVINDTFQSTFQSPFSISMWLKPDDGQDGFQRALFKTYATSSDYIVYEMQLGKLYFYIYDDSAGATRRYTTTSAVFSDGAQSSYTHTIVTVDSTATPIIYIDGSSVGLTQTHSNAISLSNYAGTGNAVIGTFSEASPAVGSKFKGKIDDVSLWSTQLSSTQASNLYNSGSGTDLTGSSDLAGWWQMGEGSTALPPNGTATISASITASATGTSYTIHSGTAVITASVTATATGALVAGFSNAYSINMDGSNDHMTQDVEIHDYDGSGGSLKTTGGTMSMWINPDSASQNAFLWGAYGSTSDRCGVAMSNVGDKWWVTLGSTSSYPVAHGMSAGTWYHVVLTWTAWDSGNDYVLYQNGSSVATGSVTTWTAGTDRTLTIGALHYVWPHLYYFNGLIDEVGLWNEGLGSSEITALYNSGSPTSLTSNAGDYTSSANLQAWWRFEENTGTSIADSSSSSHTGTLANSPTFSSTTP